MDLNDQDTARGSSMDGTKAVGRPVGSRMCADLEGTQRLQGSGHTSLVDQTSKWFRPGLGAVSDQTKSMSFRWQRWKSLRLDGGVETRNVLGGPPEQGCPRASLGVSAGVCRVGCSQVLQN